MHASPACPFERLRWTAEQLADAARDGALPAANGVRARLRIAHGYRADDALAPRFRIS